MLWAQIIICVLLLLSFVMEIVRYSKSKDENVGTKAFVFTLIYMGVIVIYYYAGTFSKIVESL